MICKIVVPRHGAVYCLATFKRRLKLGVADLSGIPSAPPAVYANTLIFTKGN